MGEIITRYGTSKILLWTMAFALVFGLSESGNAEGLLTEIKERGTIVVGTEAAFEPYEFVEDGKIVGIGKDILDYLVADLGVKLEQHDLPFQGLLPGLLAGKFDLVATSLGVTEERAERYAMTMPIGRLDYSILVRKSDDSINSPDDLNGKIVATQVGSTAIDVFKDHDKQLKAAGGEGLKSIELFTSMPETYVALANGQVDAIQITEVQAGALMEKRPGMYKLVGYIGPITWLSWATRPEAVDLRNFINEKIRELRDSGQLAELQMKWFGFTVDIPAEGYLPPGAI